MSCVVLGYGVDLRMQILRKLTIHMSQVAAIHSRPSVAP